MSGILYLNMNDFIIRKGEKGNLLCMTNLIKGMTLVLFYSNECEHSNKLLMKYKQLPYNINGCQFGMININRPENHKIINMSNNTIAPITFVPDLILYVDGVPYIRYDGIHDIHKIKEFIIQIYNKLQKTIFQDKKEETSKQQVAPPVHKQQDLIPGYTIGKPKTNSDRDDVCYLSFTKAYDQGKTQNNDPNNHLFLRHQNPNLQRPVTSQF